MGQCGAEELIGTALIGQRHARLQNFWVPWTTGHGRRQRLKSTLSPRPLVLSEVQIRHNAALNKY